MSFAKNIRKDLSNKYGLDSAKKSSKDAIETASKRAIQKTAEDNRASNQPSKFRTKNWVEINDESRGGYTTGSGIKFETTMLRSSLCDYTDAYILFKGTITITGEGDDAAARQADEINKGVIFKNCAPFTKCISKINDTQIDTSPDIDISNYNSMNISK